LIRYSIVLTLALGVFWLGLSGYFKPLLLTLGGISIALVVFLCARMKILDSETAPYLFIPKTMIYLSWLFKEIVKANVAVVKAVLNPDLEVTPTLVRIPVKHKTDMGRSMFANSITLTPGTVSVEFDEDELLVHALLKEMSAPEGFAEMGKRAGWSIGDIISDPNSDDMKA